MIGIVRLPNIEIKIVLGLLNQRIRQNGEDLIGLGIGEEAVPRLSDAGRLNRPGFLGDLTF